MSSSFNRYPYPEQSNPGRVTVVIIAALLLASVGGALFYGGAALSSVAESGALATSARRADSATPLVRPTVSTPVPRPPLAGIAYVPRPSATGTSRPTPLATPRATPTPRPTSSQGQATVGNTGGSGVWLRHTPRLTDHWVIWPDHTPLTVLGPQADGDGQHWLQVRDPKGDVGWIPARYVVGQPVANPNLMRQLAAWKAARVKNGEDPNDYPAFRRHEVAIGAPDPGPVEIGGFRG